jgi:polysaccharide export outer membrane protein
MKLNWSYVVFGLFCCTSQSVLLADQSPQMSVAQPSAGGGTGAISGQAGGASSPDESMGHRRPLYRLRANDVLEISFTFAPEFNQTVTIQPDGFITLKGAAELYVKDLTLPELQPLVSQRYMSKLHDPEITIFLRHFEKSYFIASGQVSRPGRYEMHGDETIVEALAAAGGLTDASRHSQVVLFRRSGADRMESRLLNVKQMLASRDLSEDVHIKSGDLIFVPQNRISKIRRFLPVSTVSTYLNPTQF